MQSVHPHTRGVYPSKLSDWYPVHGSSPHTWGILRAVPPEGECDRFIPTHVGYTAGGGCCVHYGAVHPHTCGAYVVELLNLQKVFWFIPTHVGYTSLWMLLYTDPPVHPHTRGVYFPAVGNFVIGVRFIPTHVGYTLRSQKIHFYHWINSIPKPYAFSAPIPYFHP